MWVAAAQSLVTPDVRRNGDGIRQLMREAKAAGAQLIHFPEGALSGYPSCDQQDWDALRDELHATSALAGDLGLWTVVGSNHLLGEGRMPHNSMYVISDAGDCVGRYDKRVCSFNEAKNHYSAGAEPLVFEVAGFRFGCALCIEVHFPELFREYEQLDVDCLLFSAHSDDPLYGLLAQAHAATNNFWVSVSTPGQYATALPSGLTGPDGHWIARCKPVGEPRLALALLDRDAPQFDVALNKARPWRRSARARREGQRTELTAAVGQEANDRS